MDNAGPPSAKLVRCKVCNSLTTLLLQLHGDLPEHFLGHERRLYIFICKRKACWRKDGSVRSVRATKVSKQRSQKATRIYDTRASSSTRKHGVSSHDLGGSLFGNKSAFPSPESANPFSLASGTKSSQLSNPSSNPFSSVSTAVSVSDNLSSNSPQLPQSPNTDLPTTFVQKARISDPLQHLPSDDSVELWPPEAEQPPPYPSFRLEAEYETLDVPFQSKTPTLNIDMDDSDGRALASSGKDDAEAFESSIDKTFQRFADVLAQNPLQILRYEFKGLPLLYSNIDAVGKLFLSQTPSSGAVGNSKVSTTIVARGAGIPHCPNCGAGRVYELQLTPQAISELEVNETGLDGMDWGTIILGVCEKDCQARGVEEGGVGYLEEWIGVQWEEVAGGKR